MMREYFQLFHPCRAVCAAAFVLALVCSVSAKEAAEDSPDILFLMNGDLLHGRLVAATPAEGVTWFCPAAEQPVRFKLSAVKEMRLQRKEATASAGTSAESTTLLLANGDCLSGRLVSLDDSSAVLETKLAGTLTIKRRMIKTILPSLGGKFFSYRGPNSLEEWEQLPRGQPGWSFRNGALYAAGDRNAVIAKNVNLLESSRIDFHLAWKGAPQFTLKFYTTDFKNPLGEGLALSVNGAMVSLRRFSKGAGMGYFGNLNLPLLATASEADFVLITNLKENAVALLVDGVLVKQWRESGGMLSSGSGMVFSAESKVKLTDVSVSAWEGEATIPPPTPGKKIDATDTMTLANKDIIAGALEKIQNNEVTFKTEFSPLTLPMDRVACVELSLAKLQTPRKFPDDVHVSLRNRDVITGRFEGIVDGKLVCASESFGEVGINLAAVKSVTFGIYVSEYFPDRKADEAW